MADLGHAECLQREADTGAVGLQVAVDGIAQELAGKSARKPSATSLGGAPARRRRDLLYAGGDVLDHLDRAGRVAKVDVDRRAVRAHRAVERQSARDDLVRLGEQDLDVRGEVGNRLGDRFAFHPSSSSRP